MPVALQVVVLFASLAGWMVGGLVLFGSWRDGTERGPAVGVGCGVLCVVSVCGFAYAATALGMIPT